MVRRTSKLLATGIILFAIFLTAGRIVTSYIPSQLPYFEQLAHELFHYDVKVESVRAMWRGFQPLFSLRNVQISNNGQTIITITKLNIGVDYLSSLWHWQFIPGTLQIEGSNLTVYQESDQHWYVLGVPITAPKHNEANKSGQKTYIDKWLEWFLSERHLSLKDIGLTYVQPNKKKITAKIEKLNFTAHASGHAIWGNAQIAQPQIAKIRIVGKIYHSSVKLDDLSGQIYLQLQNVYLPFWLKDYNYNNFQIRQGVASTEIWLNWADGWFKHIYADVDAENLTLATPKNKLWKINTQHLLLGWKNLKKEGWKAWGNIDSMTINDKAWPNTPWAFVYQQDLENNRQFQSSQIPITFMNQTFDLESWMPAEVKPIWQQVAMEGFLNNLYVSLKGDNWLLDTDIMAVNSKPWDKVPGMTNLAGHLQLNNKEGYFVLNSHNMKLDFIHAFRQSVYAKHASGTAHWQILPSGVSVKARAVKVDNNDGDGYGEFALFFPNGQKQPWLYLYGGANVTGVKNKSLYLPFSVMDKKALEWLDQGIVDGKNIRGRVVLNGNMVQFPFEGYQGTFQIAGEAHKLNLNPYTGWPPIRDIMARFFYGNRKLFFYAPSAMMFDSEIINANAVIPIDGAKTHLSLTGNVHSSIQDTLRFFLESPLNKVFGKKLAGLKGEGPLDVSMKLFLPFDSDKPNVQVSGKGQLLDDDLEIAATPIKLKKINGELSFSEKGISSPNITGEIFDKPFVSKINTKQNGETSQTSISFKTTLAVNSLLKDMPMAEKFIKGEAQLSALISFYFGKSSLDEFTFTSNLKGISIDLPEPFAKTADTTRIAFAKASMSETQPLKVEFYDGRDVRAILQFLQKPQGLSFDRGTIGLQEKSVSLPGGSGLYIKGNLDELNVDQWKALLPEKSESPATIPTYLKQVALAINDLFIWHRHIEDIDIKLWRVPPVTFVELRNREYSGTISVPDSYPDAPLNLKFNYLNLSNSDSSTPLDPNTIPPLNFYCQNLRYGKNYIGTVDMKLTPNKTGINFDRLNVGSQNYQMEASGRWQKAAMMATSLSGSFTSNNVAGLLAQFSMAQSITCPDARSKFALNWIGSPMEFDLSKVNGTISIEMHNGSFTDLGPSANLKVGLGRLVTFFSLQSLTQHLQMNFSDITNKGFTFSLLKADFKLDHGQMRTNNLVIEGPVAKITVSGRVGLAAHDLDVSFYVTPHVTSSLPVLAAFAGGPLIGLAAWLTEKAITLPVQALTTYHYHVTGSWDKPIIKPYK